MLGGLPVPSKTNYLAATLPRLDNWDLLSGLMMWDGIIWLWAHNLHNSRKKKITHNGAYFLNLLTNLLISYIFFIPWEMHGNCFLSIEYIFAANSHHFIVANQQDIPGHLYAAGSWDLCSSFYITGAMIGRNITNHSLEKKKVPGFDLFSGKTTFFPVFWPWK